MRLQLLLAALLLVGTAAHANQIAQYVSLSQGQDFVITNTAGGESLSATAVPIDFFWATALGLGSSPIPAMLTLSATSSTPAGTAAGLVIQGGWTGSFAITANGTGANLLSGTFGPNGSYAGFGGSASFSDSTATSLPSEVTYSSSVVGFANTTERDFSFSLSNFETPSGATQNAAVAGDGFPVGGTYAGNATFAATPLPLTTIPEPATFVMIGLALVGGGAFWRRKTI